MKVKALTGILAILWTTTFSCVAWAGENQTKQTAIDRINTNLKKLTFSVPSATSSPREDWTSSYEFAINGKEIQIKYAYEIIFYENELEKDRWSEEGIYITSADKLDINRTKKNFQLDNQNIILYCKGDSLCFENTSTDTTPQKGQKEKHPAKPGTISRPNAVLHLSGKEVTKKTIDDIETLFAP